MKRASTAFLLALAAAAGPLLLLTGDNPANWVAAAQNAKQKAKKAVADPPPPGAAVKPSVATEVNTLKVAKGFKVERLYSVPKEKEGSWVNLCVDPKGRLIVSDQYGALYRVTPPKVGEMGDIKLEKIPAEIGMAQGLLWAFDSLYVVVNANGGKSGVYRVKDTNNDDMLDTVETLRKFPGNFGEHGPHAIIPHPDGNRLTVVCGNQTPLMEVNSSRVPMTFGEDHLVPRVPDGNGFMKGVLAPGGCIYNITPDGKDWELVSIGFRNQYDAAYNREGELFTYDADMEWDVNTPWYRPTRVCHVVSGSDWGWRNGSAKFPVYYADTLPPVVDIGPGSPTGVTFGYGAKFPAKYQNAFFICDWSYGKLYATHMEPNGSSYKGTLEEFVTGTPLPLTDVVINPTDGAMYFTIGGRKTQSGLYRVTYTGTDNTDLVPKNTVNPRTTKDAYANRLRNFMELGRVTKTVDQTSFDILSHEDRFVRYTGRVLLEHLDPKLWADKALTQDKPETAILSLLALTRASAPCPDHAKPSSPKPTPELRAKILAALGKIDFAKLKVDEKLDLARAYQVALHRLGATTADERKAVLATVNGAFPSSNRFLNEMLLEILVFFQDDTVAPKAMKLLADAPTQEEQLSYVLHLRMLKTGWTSPLRKSYFEWFLKAAGYKGGNSFQGFLRLIKADAVAQLSKEEFASLKTTIEADPTTAKIPTAPPRPFVKRWNVDSLAPAVDEKLKAGGRDYEKGRKLFAAANCFACHRYDNEGGSNGPDLTGVAGRFNAKDLLESILDPNKEISDQYAAVEVDTLDGKKVVGRIVNLKEGVIMLNTNMLDPNGIVSVRNDNIDAMKPSKLSMMPAGLLDTLTDDESADLMAYLLSRGDRAAGYFKK